MSNAINQKDLNVMCATTAVQNASEARLTLTNTLIADWIFMMCLSQMFLLSVWFRYYSTLNAILLALMVKKV